MAAYFLSQMHSRFSSGKHIRLAGFLALALLGIGTRTVQAAPGNSWIGGNGGTWNVAGNWSGGLPNSSSTVQIDSGTANLPFGVSGTAGTVNLGTINGGNGGVNIVFGSLTLGTLNAGTFTGGTGTLAISASGTLTGNFIFGAANGGVGNMNVFGGTISGTSITLGFAAGSTGNMTVGGGTTTMSTLTIGSSGTGTLNISGTGVINVTGTTFLASAAGSQGTLNYTGNSFGSASIVGGNGTAIINLTPGNGQSFFAPNISGSSTVALNKTGSGKTTLTGSNTFSGTTTISAGTLTVNGAITNAGTVVTNGTLNGSGSVANVTVGSGGVLGGSLSSKVVTVTAGGTVSPGNSPGANSATSLSLSGSATFLAQIAAPNGGGWTGAHPVGGTDYDQMTLTGTSNGTAETVLTLDGTPGTGSILQLSVTGTLPAAGVASGANPYNPNGANTGLDNYFILNLTDGVDTISGRFARVTLDGTTFSDIDYSNANLFGGINGIGTFTIGGQLWAISYLGDSSTNSTLGGNDVVLTAVPEPATCALLGIGIAGLCIRVRRRRATRA